jgi:hypothetical protein
VLGRLGELRHRRHDPPREQPRDREREQRPYEAEQEQDDPQPGQRVVDALHVARQHQRPERHRHGERPEVLALDRPVTELRGLGSAGARQTGVEVAHRQPHAARPRDGHAVGPDELDGRRALTGPHRWRRAKVTPEVRAGPAAGPEPAVATEALALDLRDAHGLPGQVGVHLVAQLVAHREVADDRRQHDRHADRPGGEQHEAAAQRHR